MPNSVPTFSGTVLRSPGATYENQVIVNNGPGAAVLTNTAPNRLFPAAGIPFPPGSECRLIKNGTQVYAAAASTTPITAPAVPASTTPQNNTTGQDVVVQLTGGTVTVVAVNGTTVATTTGVSVVVPAGGNITLTYSVAPTWKWFGAQAANLSVTIGTQAT